MPKSRLSLLSWAENLGLSLLRVANRGDFTYQNAFTSAIAHWPPNPALKTCRASTEYELGFCRKNCSWRTKPWAFVGLRREYTRRLVLLKYSPVERGENLY